jgi:hypothetical protein
MGKGVYLNGKFDLYLSFRDALKNDAQVKTKVFAQFDKASRLLYDATNGQMQFGAVKEQKGSGTDADAFIRPGSGRNYSGNCCIRQSNRMTLYATDILAAEGPWIILHEFGHYALCLYDEYWDDQRQPAHCADPANTGHCVMEFTTVSRFCTAQTHETVPCAVHTEQQIKNKQSCWDHLSKNYCLGFQMPRGVSYANLPLCQSFPQYVFNNPHPVFLAPRVGQLRRQRYTEPAFVEIPWESRFVLLLDRSSSMTPAAITGLRFGAHFWTTYLCGPDEKYSEVLLSLVYFNHEQQVILPLSPVTPEKLERILAAIQRITPQGRTNLAGALEVGRQQMAAPGYQASTQHLILFTDGVHNTGALPGNWEAEMVDSLAGQGIRFHAVGLGPYDDQAFLQRATAAVGGQFVQLAGGPQETEAYLGIEAAFIDLAGVLRDDFGMVIQERGRLLDPTPAGLELLLTIKHRGNYSGETLTFVRERLLTARRPDIVSQYPVDIEAGSRQAAFVVSSQAAVNVYLFRPSGVPVNAEDPDVQFQHPADAPYAFYVVTHPAPGEWTLLVVRRQETGVIPFAVMACSENPELAASVNVNRQLFEIDRPIPIKATVYYEGLPLTAMEEPVALVSRESTFAPGVPTYEEVILKPEMALFDEEGNPLPPGSPKREGIYQGWVSRGAPGSYTVKVTFGAEGDGTVRRFRRVKSLQVHVGPLPPGEDVEGGRSAKPQIISRGRRR